MTTGILAADTAWASAIPIAEPDSGMGVTSYAGTQVEDGVNVEAVVTGTVSEPDNSGMEVDDSSEVDLAVSSSLCTGRVEKLTGASGGSGAGTSPGAATSTFDEAPFTRSSQLRTITGSHVEHNHHSSYRHWRRRCEFWARLNGERFW